MFPLRSKMPRVTRRSVAAKEDNATSTQENDSHSTSRGRRSTAKKDEPKPEETNIGEPAVVTPKRGGRQPAKSTVKEAEVKIPAAKERTPRSKTTKASKVKEDEEEKQDEVEEEKKVEKESSQRRGSDRKGASSAERESSAKGRASSGATRGRAAKETEAESTQVETSPSTSAGGRRSRGRAAKGEQEDAVKKEDPKPEPSSRGGRRGRAAKEETEESLSAAKEQDTSEASKSKRGSRGRGSLKSEASPATKIEATPSPKASRSSRRGLGAAAEPEEEAVQKDEEENMEEESSQATPPKEKVTEKTEPKEEASMETSNESSAKLSALEQKTVKSSTTQDKKSSNDAEETMETEETAAKEATQASTPSKKRKLEDEVETDKVEVTAKRARIEDASEDDQTLTDYVVINKEDVPAADSKEVQESLPAAANIAQESVPTVDRNAQDSVTTAVEMAQDLVPAAGPTSSSNAVAEADTKSTEAVEPGVEPPTEGDSAFLVPLTEAEIAKRYSAAILDRDETSSTHVEVGSEGPADTTTMSVRSLDTSDAVSVDSVSTSITATDETSNPPTNLNQQPVPPPTSDSTPDEGSISVSSTPPPQVQQNSSEQIPPPPTEKPIEQQNEKMEVSNDEPANHENNIDEPKAQPAEIKSSPVPQPEIAPVPINGSAEESKSNNIPQKSINDTSVPVTVKKSEQVSQSKPSSTAIDCRKFVLNSAFPVELMDPASWFSVVSYNILAECHRRRGDYSYTAEEFLVLPYRHKLILKELDYLDGDIVCLQEVDPQYYKDTLLPEMTSRGYSGWFVKRTKDYYDEGEATFVKKSRFSVKTSEGISLRELAYKEVDESGLSPEVSTAAKQYLDRADVVMLTQLQCLKTGKILTVANIHVVYDPPAPDVQCIQVACSIKQLVAKAGSDLNPHIICGDFNSTVASAGYQLAKDGYLSDDHIARLQAVEALNNTDGTPRSLIHHMWRAFQHTSSNLKSAYEVSQGREPQITTYTTDQKKGLDYIFFSADSMDNVGVTEVIDPVLIDATGGLPSKDIPSDHLSVKAVFRIK